MGEWISVKDKLPDSHEILWVKGGNWAVTRAYFWKDKMAWKQFYCKNEVSHFQDWSTKEFLYDVTHWTMENPAAEGRGKDI